MPGEITSPAYYCALLVTLDTGECYVTAVRDGSQYDPVSLLSAVSEQSSLWAARQVSRTIHNKTFLNYHRITGRSSSTDNEKKKIKVKKPTSFSKTDILIFLFVIHNVKHHLMKFYLCVCAEEIMSVTHTVTWNSTKHNAIFKAAILWWPFRLFLNLSFLCLGNRFLSISYFPAVYRQSLHMIYINLSCEISSKIYLFTMLCNSVLTIFLKWFKAGYQICWSNGWHLSPFPPPHLFLLPMWGKKLNHDNITTYSLLQVIWRGEAIHL